jgi:hypothetical protein
VLWLRAFDVLDPGDPPVPLIVLPFDSVEPAVAPLAPADDPAELPPETCAKPNEGVPRYRHKTNGKIFMCSPWMRKLRFGYRWQARIQPAAVFSIYRGDIRS